MRTIGFVVNPIAGMGGRVGLKGTDDRLQQARERGARPRAPDRVREALDAMAATGVDIALLTYAGVMGESVARDAGFDPEVVGEPEAGPDADIGETTAADTRAAVRSLLDRDVDLIVFVGGDGTAVDVAEALDGADVPVFGVPAGVKVYSSVFGVTPRAAGRVAATFEAVTDGEVNDIDEDAYRDGRVRSELHAVVTVPRAQQRQSSKQLAGGTVEAVAEGFAEEVRPDVTYVLGPGGTVGAIKTELGFEGAPLGVDVWRDGELLAEDARESEILDALGEDNVIVVSPIGGQGFVFGRGNQQLSPSVIRQCEIEIVASRRKADQLGVLRVDTGDADLDEQLRGWQRVRVGRFERRLMEIV
ncbi:ATP-NAD kinase family protein [Halapricum hydrolyticum]|uniref:ATP-NAD kinase family protein n=1 Tax=Halapricum hydrolyticum TaxID=2979991 RepID=A0AAE3I8T2_9EURY|nr:ATP-NAD kinase family protein [Halapricum hydrolyticum]MCU4716524.1 ATP-NAD kinase family protein [Halapricum hydrolyticum]MCU4725871.1 ATP-NAD kinase family protein [Halapricum hydrolyticum]